MHAARVGDAGLLLEGIALLGSAGQHGAGEKIYEYGSQDGKACIDYA